MPRQNEKSQIKTMNKSECRLCARHLLSTGLSVFQTSSDTTGLVRREYSKYKVEVLAEKPNSNKLLSIYYWLESKLRTIIGWSFQILKNPTIYKGKFTVIKSMWLITTPNNEFIFSAL